MRLLVDLARCGAGRPAVDTDIDPGGARRWRRYCRARERRKRRSRRHAASRCSSRPTTRRPRSRRPCGPSPRSCPAGGRLIVIADNCSDETAGLAARAGATVVERRDPERVGKGFAISFGLRSLDADPPDVVILVDADCRVSAGGLGALAALARANGRPVQAEYLLAAPPGASPWRWSARWRSCCATGSGRAGCAGWGFPATSPAAAWPSRGGCCATRPRPARTWSRTWCMGIELALLGTPARLCPAVQISSELPAGAAAGLGQRRRWEHGQLHTPRHYVPRLLGAGLARRRLGARGPGPRSRGPAARAAGDGADGVFGWLPSRRAVGLFAAAAVASSAAGDGGWSR